MTDSFDLSGGSATQSFSFGPQGSQPGASVTGTVVDMKEVQETDYTTKEPKTWPNGEPIMQIKLTLQTELRDPTNPEDDGKRNVYLNGYKKAHPTTGTSGTLWAVMQAVQAVTGGTSLQRGGKLTLSWVSGLGFTGDPRHYVASYQAPAMDLNAGGQQDPLRGVGAQAVAPQGDPWASVPPVQQAAYQQPSAQVASSVPRAAPTGPAQPDPAAVAAVKAAGQDPRSIWPHYVEPVTVPPVQSAEPPF